MINQKFTDFYRQIFITNKIIQQVQGYKNDMKKSFIFLHIRNKQL